MNSSPQLTDVFELASGRYKALVENYVASAHTEGSFLNEEFVKTTYRNHVLKILDQIRCLFIENYTDFSGHSLITDGELALSLDDDVVTANAYVVPRDQDGVEITLTLGMVILIDLLSTARWMHVTEVFPGKALPTPDFDAACSNNLAVILKSNLSQGVTERCKVRWAGFFTGADKSMQAEWERTTSLSLLWVLSHEVGHFLCGHVGYYKQRHGVLGLSEKSVRTELEAMLGTKDSVPLTDLSSSITKWACELMADTYATIRVAWIVCQEVKEKKLDLSISELLGLISTSSTLPGIAFLLERKLSGEAQIDFFKEFYPSEWCRIFNAFATLVFIVLPLENAYIDVRKNPLESFWQERLLTGWQMFLVGMLDTFEGLKHFLWVFNLTPFALEENDQISENICGSMLSARNGLVILQTASLETPTAVTPYLAQWAVTMKALCTETNLYFAAHLKKSWLTRGGEEVSAEMVREDVKEYADVLLKIGGLANDPAYKILDDWMSQIQATWHSEESWIKERLRECALHGWHIVEIRRRL